MSNNQPAENIIKRLEQVDSKLEKLLAIQALQREGDLSETSNSPEEESSKGFLRPPLDNDDGKKAHGPSESSNHPLPSKVAISAMEMDSIFQKVDKINHDAEMLERIGKLERQNRKITILGSMFMTLSVLALGAFGYMMIQGNPLNKEVALHAGKKVDPPKSFSGEVAARELAPQLPAPIIATQNPAPAVPVIKETDPQPVKPPADPKSAEEVAPVTEEVAPVKYVGYMASNKYHYPDCKWATKISRYKHWTFSSVKEAREKGYIPCSTCRPSESD